MPNKNMIYKRFCKRCGDIFETEKKHSRFCNVCKRPSGNIKLKPKEVEDV